MEPTSFSFGALSGLMFLSPSSDFAGCIWYINVIPYTKDDSEGTGGSNPDAAFFAIKPNDLYSTWFLIGYEKGLENHVSRGNH